MRAADADMEGDERICRVPRAALECVVFPLMARVTPSSAFVGPVVQLAPLPYIALLFHTDIADWWTELYEILFAFDCLTPTIVKFVLPNQTHFTLREDTETD